MYNILWTCMYTKCLHICNTVMIYMTLLCEMLSWDFIIVCIQSPVTLYME